MRTLLWRLILIASAVAAGSALARTPVRALGMPDCDGCLKARYWPVKPDAWREPSATARAFPETAALVRLRPHDLGIAFSGGGTRSAAATVGQLRGLQRNGWLDRVRYMTAVSGGSWTVVPFTFADGRFDLPQLLGRSTLDADSLIRPEGLLANSIVESRLAGHGVIEAAHLRRQASLSARVNDVIDMLRDRRIGGGMRGEDKTFARILEKVFLKDLLPAGAAGRYVSWTDEQTAQVTLESQLGADRFVTAADRPFLIVGGTIVVFRPASTYPALLPIEYTPLYSGVRQQFGDRIGGGYLRSWAYGSRPVAMADADHVLVRPDDNHRFTLADMVASSGAAPQLTLLLGKGPERLRAVMERAAMSFPYFPHFSVRDGAPTPAPAAVAHGDGGFTDNLGIMPLLARGVKNVLVFVNSSSAFGDNTQLQSYFMPVHSRTGSGDKTLNHVFDSDRWNWLMAEFKQRRRDGEALVACSAPPAKGWRVRANEHYNIAAYEDLRICWVYNHDAPKWRDGIADIARLLWPPPATPGQPAPRLTRLQKQFQHFPWFATFEENKPYVIKLSAAQVNVLAHLSEWAITNETSARMIASAFGDALPARPQS